MMIFIPSRDRVLGVRGGPLVQFSEEWRRRTRYVVPPDQSMRYCEQMINMGHSTGKVLEFEVPGKLDIAEKRKFIGEYCRDEGIDKFVVMDDDVHFVQRAAIDRINLVWCDDVTDMLESIEGALDHYAHVGISMRQGNNNLGIGVYEELHSENTRTCRVLAYRTEEFLSVEHGRVEVMEDFDVNLQLLRRGHKNLLIGWWAQDQKMTNAPGGCSTYRTHELHEASARKLAELHPGLVTLRQKKNKGGGAFGSRTEVTIQWKKAYGKDL